MQAYLFAGVGDAWTTRAACVQPSMIPSSTVCGPAGGPPSAPPIWAMRRLLHMIMSTAALSSSDMASSSHPRSRRQNRKQSGIPNIPLNGCPRLPPLRSQTCRHARAHAQAHTPMVAMCRRAAPPWTSRGDLAPHGKGGNVRNALWRRRDRVRQERRAGGGAVAAIIKQAVAAGAMSTTAACQRCGRHFTPHRPDAQINCTPAYARNISRAAFSKTSMNPSSATLRIPAVGTACNRP